MDSNFLGPFPFLARQVAKHPPGTTAQELWDATIDGRALYDLIFLHVDHYGFELMFAVRLMLRTYRKYLPRFPRCYMPLLDAVCRVEPHYDGGLVRRRWEQFLNDPAKVAAKGRCTQPALLLELFAQHYAFGFDEARELMLEKRSHLFRAYEYFDDADARKNASRARIFGRELKKAIATIGEFNPELLMVVQK